MNLDFFSDLRDLISVVWQYQPFLVVAIAGAVVLFVLVVIDARRHRKKQKARHKRLH